MSSLDIGDDASICNGDPLTLLPDMEIPIMYGRI
jgi:hypothetical protein